MQSTATARDMQNDTRKDAAPISNLHETIGKTTDELQNAARQAGHHVREVADAYSHTVAESAENLKMKIRGNPVQSSVIALGVGFVLGKLLRR